MKDQNLNYNFHTQMLLPHFGFEKQNKLRQARVLVMGAGGLGCPCLQYLVSSGIGTIGICDGDLVEAGNLHRQILFTSEDIGKHKVNAARERLSLIYKETNIQVYPEYLDAGLALQIFPLFDLIIDCTDDMHTRYLISDGCMLLNKPFVFAAVYRYEAQVAVFNSDAKRISLRDVFGQLGEEMLSCSETGILGAVAGIAGCIQALEAIKFIAGLKGGLQNQWLMMNLQSYSFYKTEIDVAEKSRLSIPKSREDFLMRGYKQLCFVKNDSARDLNQEEFLRKIVSHEVQVIDVRNENELPVINDFKCQNIPLKELLAHPEKVDSEKEILLFCHSGIRSLEALEFLTEVCGYKRVSHLKGGIIKWKSI